MSDIPNQRSGKQRPAVGKVTCLCAFGWAVIFSAAHYYWIFGRIGLGDAAIPVVDTKFVIAMSAISTLFLLAGLFPLGLVSNQSKPNDILDRVMTYGSCSMLMLLAVTCLWKGFIMLAIAAMLGAAALAGVRLLYGRNPIWVYRIGTIILGSGMALYGLISAAVIARHVLGIQVMTGGATTATLAFGSWWFLGGILFLASAIFSPAMRSDR